MVFIRQNIREARALYRSNALPIAPQSHVRELQRRVNTLIRQKSTRGCRRITLEKNIPAPRYLVNSVGMVELC